VSTANFSNGTAIYAPEYSADITAFDVTNSWTDEFPIALSFGITFTTTYNSTVLESFQAAGQMANISAKCCADYEPIWTAHSGALEWAISGSIRSAFSATHLFSVISTIDAASIGAQCPTVCSTNTTAKWSTI
jgi:hypothetical protein